MNKNRSVLILIRFYNGRFHACKNSLISKLSIIHNYNGRVIGMASQIQCDSKTWNDHDWLALIDFYNEEEATRFICGCPDIRQFDWLDGVDIIMISGYKELDTSKRWISLSYNDDNNQCLIDCKCVTPINETIQEYGGDLIILPNNKIENIRGLWNISSMFAAQWENADQFQKFQNDGKCKELNGTTILLCKVIQLGEIKGKFNEIDY
ncbi:hypothetical protein A3Q56_03689 [Intoshia linei]|uniref:Uncharacterized protein n=1 Tax=Intoshia linei TaxID=1819745 RepID=A0A177B4D6_9BILA|nr:hypothetical protein A3Q56_03689 [Intoshia linei]